MVQNIDLASVLGKLRPADFQEIIRDKVISAGERLDTIESLELETTADKVKNSSIDQNCDLKEKSQVYECPFTDQQKITTTSEPHREEIISEHLEEKSSETVHASQH